MAYTNSELTSETMKPLRHFCRTPWTGDPPITRPVPTQDSTTQRIADICPCLERDSNPRSSVRAVEDHTRLRPTATVIVTSGKLMALIRR